MVQEVKNEVETLKHQNREQAEIIQSLKSEMKNQTEVIQSQSTRIDEQQEIIISQSVRIQSQEVVIESLKKEMKKQTETSQSQAARIDEQKEAIQSQTTTIESQSARIQSQEVVIESLKNEMKNQTEIIQSQSQMIHELQHQMQQTNSISFLVYRQPKRNVSPHSVFSIIHKSTHNIISNQATHLQNKCKLFHQSWVGCCLVGERQCRWIDNGGDNQHIFISVGAENESQSNFACSVEREWEMELPRLEGKRKRYLCSLLYSVSRQSLIVIGGYDGKKYVSFVDELLMMNMDDDGDQKDE